MEELRIEFASTNEVYFPGQYVNGNIYIRLKEAIKARCVMVSINGKARTNWTMHESRKTSHGKTHSESVPYYSEILYTDQATCVWESTAELKRLPIGETRYPFSFLLPTNCPPTFEGSLGFIRYYIKVKIDRPWHKDNVCKSGFTVTPHFDLNSIPYAAMPTLKQMSKNLGFLFFKDGQLDVKISLSKTGYASGESLEISMDINNCSKKDVSRIELSLIQSALCSADRHPHYTGYNNWIYKDTETKEEIRKVVEYVENVKFEKQSSGRYQRLLKIPPTVPSFNVCPIIVLSYYLKIKVVTKGTISNSMSCEMPVLIGTIPTRVASSLAQSIEYPQSIAPPMPSVLPPDYETSQLTYGNCLIDSENLLDDQEHAPKYTPKYICYNNLP